MLRQWGSTCCSGYSIDQMDASVAPPRLISCNVGCNAQARSGSVRGIQSPDSIATRRLDGNALRSPSAYSSNMLNKAGTEFHRLT